MRISELSRRVDVSADTLRVWERRYGVLKPRRSAGNARLYSALDEARIRLMKRYISEQIPPAKAARLSIAARLDVRAGQSSDVPEDEASHAIERMREALEAFDESAAERALQRLLSAHCATAVIRAAMLPYLREVGERWAANDLSAAEGHFAGNFVESRLMAMARGWDRGLGPRALLACAPAEQHTVALIAFGIGLHNLGWRITYLGAATPVEMLDRAAAAVHPDLIVVSATLIGGLSEYLEPLWTIGERWSLALAGPAAGAKVAERCGARQLEGDPITAARSVASVSPARRRPPAGRSDRVLAEAV